MGNLHSLLGERRVRAALMTFLLHALPTLVGGAAMFGLWRGLVKRLSGTWAQYMAFQLFAGAIGHTILWPQYIRPMSDRIIAETTGMSLQEAVQVLRGLLAGTGVHTEAHPAQTLRVVIRKDPRGVYSSGLTKGDTGRYEPCLCNDSHRWVADVPMDDALRLLEDPSLELLLKYLPKDGWEPCFICDREVSTPIN